MYLHIIVMTILRIFLFIYNDNEKVWELSPAYDLTYSNSIGGEHATMVDGNGRNPGMKEILQVAEKYST